ncbi:GNAT family N-acetyltransferase [Xylanibacillus composti]|nr:GNAT family N-acyltransferase [Xylanibacillus composti]
MMQLASQAQGSQDQLAVMIATSQDDIEEALRLRYRVFVEEEKKLQLMNDSGLEQDRYDEFCDHLIVKHLGSGQVVGTYRLLPGDRAMQHGGFYSESEFDLNGFAEQKPMTMELGRSCVDPAYRSGKVIQMLWEGIAACLASSHHKYLIGCASVRLKSLDELNLIYTMLRRRSIITDRFGIRPLATHRISGLREVETELSDKELFRRLPPLMKGYQWLGAEIGGDPAYDDIFETIDFLIVLEKERVTRRYQKHFFHR